MSHPPNLSARKIEHIVAGAPRRPSGQGVFWMQFISFNAKTIVAPNTFDRDFSFSR
jgi:hypothetical protein